MLCSKTALLRIADAVVLTIVYLFQNVVLNYYLILHSSASFASFLWFLGDFFIVLLFSFTLFLAHRHHQKAKSRARRSASRASFVSGTRSSTPQGSDSSDDSTAGWMSFNQLIRNSRLPFSYFSWMAYTLLLIIKITVLFKAGVPQTLRPDELLGPQMLKFCIGLSAIIFSLLVEAHHNAADEPLRNAYLNSVAFGIALEILDSTSFLSMLIPSEQHLSYPFGLENYVIALAAVNIMLPAVTIYKLTASNFGRVYNVPLETAYKVLHLIFVNVPFLCLRLYLWKMLATDTAIFMIKNIYAIIGFIRGIYPDLKLLKAVFRQRIQLRTINIDKAVAISTGSANSNGRAGRSSSVMFQNAKYFDEKAGTTGQPNSIGNSIPSVTIQDDR